MFATEYEVSLGTLISLFLIAVSLAWSGGRAWEITKRKLRQQDNR